MASLTQFGVPIEGGTTSILMPKLQYRFRVNMLDFGRNSATREFTQNVISVTRPNLTHEEITLDAYNSKAYIAGKHTWDPITITLRDDINGNVNKAIAEQLQIQLNHGTQGAPASGGDYKFGVTIEQLDGSDQATVIETWSLNGCFIQNVQYGENNYATSDVMQITLSIRFDNADIHAGSVSDANATGALTDGSLDIGGFNNALTGASTGA